jgi:hypothetical protein
MASASIRPPKPESMPARFNYPSLPGNPDSKTKVWGFANQYDIQINLRRMEQFVLVNLCCHSWLEPGVVGKSDLADSNVTEAEGHVD